jgi:hypothetical protein
LNRFFVRRRPKSALVFIIAAGKLVALGMAVKFGHDETSQRDRKWTGSFTGDPRVRGRATMSP